MVLFDRNAIVIRIPFNVLIIKKIFKLDISIMIKKGNICACLHRPYDTLSLKHAAYQRH